MVPESNESLEKLVLLIPKSLRITVTDIRAITGSITGPLIWRSLLGRGKGFITGMGGGGRGVGEGCCAAESSIRRGSEIPKTAHTVDPLRTRELTRALASRDRGSHPRFRKRVST